MHHPISVSLAAMGVALLVAVGGVAAADRPLIPATLSPKLQEALKGRTAGAPVDCISLPRTQGSRIVDETAVIYKQSSRRWYVNFPERGDCPGLKPSRAIVTRIPGTRLCRMDLINVVDLQSRFDFGGCSLGPFVPYTK